LTEFKGFGLVGKIIKKIQDLIKEKFTGKLIISFNQGVISRKVKIEFSEELN